MKSKKSLFLLLVLAALFLVGCQPEEIKSTVVSRTPSVELPEPSQVAEPEEEPAPTATEEFRSGIFFFQPSSAITKKTATVEEAADKMSYLPVDWAFCLGPGESFRFAVKQDDKLGYQEGIGPYVLVLDGKPAEVQLQIVRPNDLKNDEDDEILHKSEWISFSDPPPSGEKYSGPIRNSAEFTLNDPVLVPGASQEMSMMITMDWNICVSPGISVAVVAKDKNSYGAQSLYHITYVLPVIDGVDYQMGIAFEDAETEKLVKPEIEWKDVPPLD